jgi:hypothetical protein
MLKTLYAIQSSSGDWVFSTGTYSESALRRIIILDDRSVGIPLSDEYNNKLSLAQSGSFDNETRFALMKNEHLNCNRFIEIWHPDYTPYQDLEDGNEGTVVMQEFMIDDKGLQFQRGVLCRYREEPSASPPYFAEYNDTKYCIV